MRVIKYLVNALRSDKVSSRQVVFWFILSLAVASIYSGRIVSRSFIDEYVVQDDARQHVFWTQRFSDPDLFPHDLIADYYQSVAPAGYSTLYWLGARLGIDPEFLSKIMPAALALIATAYCFGLCMRIWPSPVAGFIAALFLNQCFWTRDDLASSTPRAFLYPLFLAFLYYLLRRSWPACLGALALQGLFYPSIAIVSAAILPLRLLQLKGWRVHISRDRREYLLCAAGLAVTMLTLLPFAIKSSGFGPVVTASEAKGMAEFAPGGRTAYFEGDPWLFWVRGQLSGILPGQFPPLVWSGFLLPVLLLFKRRFSLAEKRNVALLWQIALVSFCLYFAAHALLFRLYLPSRYTQHSMLVVMSLMAGISLAMMLEEALRWAGKRTVKQLTALAAAGTVGLAIVVTTESLTDTPIRRSKIGRARALYEFFSNQPKDILVASLSREVDNLPTFSRRSILLGREYALSYHTRYYSQIRQRALDLIHAQYSEDLSQLQNFIRNYGVDFLVVDRRAFTAEYLANGWIQQFQPEAALAQERLAQGAVTALSKVTGRCEVFTLENLLVIKADCILGAGNE
jgi:hypothetical protein